MAIQLTCARPDLVLTSLTSADAEELHMLLQTNRAHLMRWSDYSDEIGTTVTQWRHDLSERDDLDFGMRVDHRLVGRARLLGHGHRYGLGYWVAGGFTNRGLATAAVAALIAHARDGLRATDLLAGISPGNIASARVLQRNGFTRVARFETYDRHHLRLTSDGLSAIAAAAL